MKTLTQIPNRQKALLAGLIIFFVLGSYKGYAQKITGNGTESDTVTYVLYDNGLSFDSKRSVIINDKQSVDSLANVLAASSSKNYRMVYEKQGQQAKVITAKDLKSLDKSGFFQITIAYNKPELASDDRPLYVISGK